MKLTSILTTAVLSLGALAGSAHAQQVATLKPVQWGYYNSYDGHEQREYEAGFREGSHIARDDVRHGRGFLLYEHGAYKEHPDREYREGFERGYRDSYRSYRQGYYRDWHDRYRDDDRYWIR